MIHGILLLSMTDSLFDVRAKSCTPEFRTSSFVRFVSPCFSTVGTIATTEAVLPLIHPIQKNFATAELPDVPTDLPKSTDHAQPKFSAEVKMPKVVRFPNTVCTNNPTKMMSIATCSGQAIARQFKACLL